MTLGLDHRLHFQDPSLRAQISAQNLEKLKQSTLKPEPQVVFDNQATPIPLEEVFISPQRFQSEKKAFLSVPLENGKSLVIPLENINKDHLLESLAKATPLNPLVQKNLIHAAAPLLAEIRHFQTATPTDQVAPFVGVAPAEAKLNPLDLSHKEKLEKIEKAIDEKIKAGTLKAEDKHRAVLSAFLTETSPTFSQASAAKRNAVLNFLKGIPLQELIGAEIQGAGGEAVGGGVIGEGATGHYTNSILTSLVQLLNTGRLNKKLFTELKALQTAPLHDDLKGQRLNLLRSAIQDVAFPHQINQHARGTCAATTGQILLALKDPAKYLKYVQALASPEGKAEDGKIMREPDTQKDDKSGRSITGRLIQPAFMEYANQDLNYDNTTDKHSDDHGGLKDFETTHLLQLLFPEQNFSNYSIHQSEPKPTPAQVYDQLKTHVDKGSPISVGLRWSEGGHRVIVSKIDEAAKQVFVLNPWGELQTIPLDEFKERLKSACLPNESKGEKAAIETLPGAMAKTETYQPLATERYRTQTEEMQRDPLLKAAFTEDQQKAMGKALTTLKLGTYALEYLKKTCAKHALSPAQAKEITTQIERCTSSYEALQLLRLVETGYDAVKKGLISQNELSQLLNVRPGSYMTADEDKAILTALKGEDKKKVTDLIANSAQALSKDYAKVGYVSLPAAKQEAFRLLAIKDLLRTGNMLSEPVSQLLLSLKPEKHLNQDQMTDLYAALALGDQSKVEKTLVLLISKDKAQWRIETATDKLVLLAQAGCWEAFQALSTDLAKNWTLHGDNVAEATTVKIKAIIDQAPQEVLKTLYATMNDLYQDAATANAKKILQAAKNW